MTEDERPSGIAAAHQRRHDRRSKELAGAHPPSAPEARPAPPQAPLRRSSGTWTETVVTRSGAVLTTVHGVEPRQDVAIGTTREQDRKPPARIGRFGRTHHLGIKFDG